MSDEETIATDGVGLEGAEDTETTGTETPAAEGTTEGAGTETEAPELEAAATEGEETEEGEGEGYKPNLKFKVMDKEYEIPKEFAPLITDEKSEKMVRELHEKAFGLDVVKQKFNETREERNSLVAEATKTQRSIGELRNIVQTAVKPGGNILKLEDFFTKLNIPEEVVMKYALAKVQFSELPPEQKQMLAANMDAERRTAMLEQQSQTYQEQLNAQAAEIKGQQLDYTLARDEYKGIADDWDARIGKPGSFRNLVAQVGHLSYLQSDGKVDLTPEQAVKQVIEGYGLQAPNANGNGQENPGSNVQGAAGKRVIQRATNTIPNIQGRSSSPLKTKPKSIDDLKKLYNEYAKAEG